MPPRRFQNCQPECEAASWAGGMPPGSRVSKSVQPASSRPRLAIAERSPRPHSHQPPGPVLRPPRAAGLRERPPRLPAAAATARLPGPLRPSRTPWHLWLGVPPAGSAPCGRGPVGAAPSAGDSGIHDSDCWSFGPSSRPALPEAFPGRRVCRCEAMPGAPSAPPLDGDLALHFNAGPPRDGSAGAATLLTWRRSREGKGGPGL